MTRHYLAYFLISWVCAVGAFGADLPASLTLKEARDIALRTHPRISVAELRAMVAHQGVTEARAGMLPNLSANAGIVGSAEKNTRIVAGGLTVSSVFDRGSAGLTLSQLVTDFGRTANLTDGAKLHSQAEDQRVEATRAQMVLEVDGAYYGALQAQSVLKVLDQTVATRQLLRDRVKTLADNDLKSSLDVKFAEVSYQEARLLRSRADNDLEGAHAVIAALLGRRDEAHFQLIEEPMPGGVATNISDLVFMALKNRPELQRQRLERASLYHVARAEGAMHYPTISVQGSAGILPVRDSALNESYAAAGVILNLPLYAGNFYTARQEQALFRARAADAALADEENSVVRDVRIAWLNARNAWERLDIARQLVEQARDSFSLADARYQAGTSSIVEVSQAQLSQTSAEITLANARFEYVTRLSILDYQTGKAP